MRDPAAAVAISIKAINAAGNQNYLTQAGETYRWKQESDIVAKGTSAGSNIGVIDPDRFAFEVASYAKAGIFANGTPKIEGTYDPSVAAPLYQNNALVWPGG